MRRRPGPFACSTGSRPSRNKPSPSAPARRRWLAGPGAGKTKTLTHRAAYLLASGRAQPWEILAVTFSVRAAGELRLRLADLLGEQEERGVTPETLDPIGGRII